MQNDVKQVDREAGIKLAEHVLRNLSDKALRDVNPNDVFQHMAAHRIAAEAAKDAEIAALQARVAELLELFSKVDVQADCLVHYADDKESVIIQSHHFKNYAKEALAKEPTQ